MPHTPHECLTVGLILLFQVGLDVLRRKGTVLRCYSNMAETVTFSEIGMSVAVLEAAYNIDSLMLRYQVKKLRDVPEPVIRQGNCGGAAVGSDAVLGGEVPAAGLIHMLRHRLQAHLCVLTSKSVGSCRTSVLHLILDWMVFVCYASHDLKRTDPAPECLLSTCSSVTEIPEISV